MWCNIFLNILAKFVSTATFKLTHKFNALVTRLNLDSVFPNQTLDLVLPSLNYHRQLEQLFSVLVKTMKSGSILGQLVKSNQ